MNNKRIRLNSLDSEFFKEANMGHPNTYRHRYSIGISKCICIFICICNCLGIHMTYTYSYMYMHAYVSVCEQYIHICYKTKIHNQ